MYDALIIWLRKEESPKYREKGSAKTETKVKSQPT